MPKLNLSEETPGELGFSMPAEWEQHEATWLGWPHNPSDWPDKLDTIRWVYGEMVRKISAGRDCSPAGGRQSRRKVRTPVSDPGGVQT